MDINDDSINRLIPTYDFYQAGVSAKGHTSGPRCVCNPTEAEITMADGITGQAWAHFPFLTNDDFDSLLMGGPDDGEPS